MEANTNLARPTFRQAVDDFCQYVLVRLHRLLLAVTVLDTLFAGSCSGQFTTQVAFQGGLHCAGRAGRGFDAELVKELDGSSAHPTTEHYFGFLLVDEAWHLAWLVRAKIRIRNHFHGFDFRSFNIYKGEKGTTPEMVGYNTF
jgi:hypothetical protein